MKRLFVTSLLLALFICSFAVPSTRNPFSVKQSDGTNLTLVLIGDETFHYLSTTDGVPVIEDNGTYYYATAIDGSLAATNIIAHDEDLRSSDESSIATSLKEETNSTISNTWSNRLQKRNAARARTNSNVNESRLRNTFGSPTSYLGKKKGLVILVEFKDLKFKPNNTPEQFARAFNELNYSDDSSSGSVHDYFYDQSYGKFDIEFDIYGPVTLSNNCSYYGMNDENGNDTNVCKLVEEACNLIKDECDFSQYDWNGDNEVEQVYIIYAGPGEHAGAGKNYIWPHEWTLEEAYFKHNEGNGVISFGKSKINTYAMSCELAGSSASSTQMDGIGTACHEFSHCLGLPDMYCTNDGDYAYGMSYFDILCRGSINGANRHGESPSGYTAYERYFAGWLEPIELNSPCDIINMPCIGDAPIAYIIYNDANKYEYFMIENRQPSNTWFSTVNNFTGLSGLLIYHINYDSTAWTENQVNYTHENQRMSVVPADNSYGSLNSRVYSVSKRELYGDLFPGYNNVTEFTDFSHAKYGGYLFNPNTDGTYLHHKPITNIKEEDGLISFSFMGGGETIDCLDIDNCNTSNINPEYYNLCGSKTSNITSSKGIFIMRSNGVTKKIIK